jgi:hypothetical protein
VWLNVKVKRRGNGCGITRLVGNRVESQQLGIILDSFKNRHFCNI